MIHANESETIMDYYEAKQQLDALLRNGQISLDEYEIEVYALRYAHGEAMSARDDAREVTA